MTRRTSTRDRLVRAAAELFLRQGYGQTGVSAILERAQATSGSFYHFFQAKEDLLVAVVDNVRQSLEAEVFGPVASATRDPIERVFEVLGYYRQFLATNEFALGLPMGILANELSESHPQLRSKLAGLFGAWTTGVEDLLYRAGDRLPKDLDLSALAVFVLTTMEGACIQARAGRSMVPFDASVSQLRNYFRLLENGAGSTSQAPLVTKTGPSVQTHPPEWKSW
ncbi:MAG: TetR/AcrR family transcriptional regulator [Thermoanaerobaculales bacterium]